MSPIRKHPVSNGVKIIAKVIPNSKQTEVIKLSNNTYRIKVNAPSKQNKANNRLIEIIAKYFKVSKSEVKIIHGQKSRNKLIEIV